MTVSLPIMERAAAAAQAQPPGGGAERRRDPRTLFNGEATILPCDAGRKSQPITVRVRDISRSGIGITHTSGMVRGERFIAILPPDIARMARGVLCTVVRSAPAPDGGFHIGATFSALVRPSVATKPAPVGQVATPAPAAKAPAESAGARPVATAQTTPNTQKGSSSSPGV